MLHLQTHRACPHGSPGCQGAVLPSFWPAVGLTVLNMYLHNLPHKAAALYRVPRSAGCSLAVWDKVHIIRPYFNTPFAVLICLRSHLRVAKGMQKFCHIMAVFSQNRSTRAMLSQMQSAIFITMERRTLCNITGSWLPGPPTIPVMEMSPTSISSLETPSPG